MKHIYSNVLRYQGERSLSSRGEKSEHKKKKKNPAEGNKNAPYDYKPRFPKCFPSIEVTLSPLIRAILSTVQISQLPPPGEDQPSRRETSSEAEKQNMKQSTKKKKTVPHKQKDAVKFSPVHLSKSMLEKYTFMSDWNVNIQARNSSRATSLERSGRVQEAFLPKSAPQGPTWGPLTHAFPTAPSAPSLPMGSRYVLDGVKVGLRLGQAFLHNFLFSLRLLCCSVPTFLLSSPIQRVFQFCLVSGMFII